MFKFLFVIIIAMFYFDCDPSKNSGSNSPANNIANTNTQNQQIPKDLLITLARTECYGLCPVYKVGIKADGAVMFEGIKNTETKGISEGKIDETQIKNILREFENADYFNLEDRYDSKNCPLAATDNSTAVTSIQINGRQKTVSHYLGCAEDNQQRTPFPPKLRELENKIDEIAGTKRWIGERK